MTAAVCSCGGSLEFAADVSLRLSEDIAVSGENVEAHRSRHGVHFEVCENVADSLVEEAAEQAYGEVESVFVRCSVCKRRASADVELAFAVEATAGDPVLEVGDVVFTTENVSREVVEIDFSTSPTEWIDRDGARWLSSQVHHVISRAEAA